MRITAKDKGRKVEFEGPYVRDDLKHGVIVGKYPNQPGDKFPWCVKLVYQGARFHYMKVNSKGEFESSNSTLTWR